MSQAITLLPEATINQIAAGEVIENPASVVKELIDNSLDAGAREIRVEIAAGGRQRVAVIDDGRGIAGDQALLAIERHATSKIRSAGDLVDLATMGFRGEALASIAAVSRLQLLSSDGEQATRLEVAGGRVARCEAAGRARGTTVEVRDLFFNAPVRRRFQSTLARDTSAVQRTVELLALAHPEVRFRLIHGEKTLLETLGEDRVADVLGAAFVAEMEPMRAREGNVSLRGLIGLPSFHRPNRLAQYTFINRRPVRSRLVSDAVREGYGGRLPERRFPAFVLYLDLPGELVDCNVHPQKREVRLREEPILRRIIAQAVGEALGDGVVPQVVAPPQFSSAPSRPLPSPQPTKESPDLIPPALRLVALVGRYALVEGLGEGLSIVDLPAAYRQVACREFRSEQPPAQLLLVPLTIHLAPREAELAQEYLPALQKLGFGIRSLGGESFLIDAVPVRIGIERAHAVLIDLLDGLTRTSDVALELANLSAPTRYTEGEALELASTAALPAAPLTEAALRRLMSSL